MSEPENITIAKISSRQAIIIALITALSGILGAVIQKYGFSSYTDEFDPITQNQLRFQGIQFSQPDEIKRYRIIFEVDGVPYSYPGKQIWKNNDPKVPDTSFPLYASISNHNVNIIVIYETKTGDVFSAYTEQGKILKASSEVINLNVVKSNDTSRSGIIGSVLIKIEEI